MYGIEGDDSRRGANGAPPAVKLALALIASVALMMFDRSGNALDPLRDVLTTIIYPLTVIADLPADIVGGFGDYLERERLAEENTKLREEVLLLRGRLQKLAALQAENARIRALLRSSRELEEETLIAEILATSPDPYRHYVKLNKGRVDGVFVGQALIDADGIMGQIIEANPISATAVLITDANHGIPVEVNRTGLQTIAQGTGNPQRLSLPFLAVNADVREGDLLVSSGLGGRYPAGYPVARVTTISHRPGDEFLSVTAEPTASLKRGREALLVTKREPGRNDAANDDDEAAAAQPAPEAPAPPSAPPQADGETP